MFSIFTVTLLHTAAGGAARSSGQMLSDCQREKLGAQSATLHT